MTEPRKLGNAEKVLWGLARTSRDSVWACPTGKHPIFVGRSECPACGRIGIRMASEAAA